MERMMAMPAMGMMSGMPMGMPMPGMPGMPMPGMPMPGMSMPGMPMPPMPMAMVPRCKLSMKPMENGMKMMLTCDEPQAAAALQGMSDMLSGGMMSSCMLMNGMPVLTMNMGMMGMSRCSRMEGGVMLEMRTGDAAMMAVMQSCMGAMTKMMEAGMACCMMMNGMPMAYCG